MILVLMSASAEAHPLIDFDWTAIIQLAIFVALFLAARVFLFKPYLRMRDDREAGIDGARREAAAMSADADARLADYESQLDAARSRANEERRKIRGDAATKQREVTEAARVKAVQAMESAQARVAEQVESARSELSPQAENLAADMVERLLGRKVA